MAYYESSEGTVETGGPLLQLFISSLSYDISRREFPLPNKVWGPQSEG